MERKFNKTCMLSININFTYGTLHLNTCHECFHFLCNRFRSLYDSYDNDQNSKLRITLNCQDILPPKKKKSLQNVLTGGSALLLLIFLPLTSGQNAIHFTGMPIFSCTAKKKREKENPLLVTNVFLLFGCGLSLPFVLVIVLFSMHGSRFYDP